MEMRPGQKQTELGTIPEDWEITRLGELSDFVTSGSRGWAAYYSDHGALFIRSQNIRSGRLNFQDSQFVTPPSGTEGNRTRLKRDDLLITITGNSVGNVARVEQDFDEAYVSQHVGLVRLSEPEIADFVCRYLSPGSPGNSQILLSQSGQSKPGLNLRNLQEFWVALPASKAEQRAIATALSDMDALLDGLTRLIAKKRDLKQATMQQLLTGQTRLPGFRGGWVEKALCEIATVSKGNQLHNSESDPDGLYPHYNGGMEPSSFAARFNTPANTIAISEGGNSCGFVQFITRPFWCGGHCYAVLPTAVDNDFLFHALKGKQSEIMGLRVGSGLPNVQKSALASFKLRIPQDPDEQTAIAAVLSDMGAELTVLDARLTKTRALKQAMMSELLTGKTRLPTE